MIRTSLFVAALFCAALQAAPAAAQEEEIVVTGSRLESWDRFPAPHAFITRRADFAVVEINIRNDTREAAAREGEIVEALRLLEGAARRADMSLALIDDEIGIVRTFTLDGARQLIQGGGRADTSSLTIRLRTAVTASDTLDTIHERVSRFVANAPKPGRVEMSVGSTDLTMVNLERYRGDMLREILAEAQQLSQMSGGVQNVQVGGLENQVAFKRSSDLELVLFLPYQLNVTMAAPQP
ncbi:MAG: hypothetical protein AB7O98_08225 [Hyphomonadaceae bacterium]